jgi:hypothetical protein
MAVAVVAASVSGPFFWRMFAFRAIAGKTDKGQGNACG